MVEVLSILIFSDLWACWMRAIDLFIKNLKYFERFGHWHVYLYSIFVGFFISLLFVKGVVSKETAPFLCLGAPISVLALRMRESSARRESGDPSISPLIGCATVPTHFNL